MTNPSLFPQRQGTRVPFEVEPEVWGLDRHRDPHCGSNPLSVEQRSEKMIYRFPNE